MVLRVIGILIIIQLGIMLFGFVSCDIGANRYVVLPPTKKYINSSEAGMEKAISDAADTLRSRVTCEYTRKNSEGIYLRGYLVRPDESRGEPPPSPDRYIFCIHSYRSEMCAFEFGEAASVWLSRGYNLFLIDHRAHGESSGKWISFGQHESVDCIEWLSFMRNEFGENIQVSLWGQSMGASIVLLMSGMKSLPENVRCVISDSGYTRFYEELWNLLPLPNWLRTVTMCPMQLYLRAFYHVDMKASDALAAVRQARVPILFIHGVNDLTVPLWMNDQLWEACTGEKERVVFETATHIKSHLYDPELYEMSVTRFVEKHFANEK